LQTLVSLVSKSLNNSSYSAKRSQTDPSPFHTTPGQISNPSALLLRAPA
jgi:hypothetical protein